MKYDGERAKLFKKTNSTTFTSPSGPYNPYANFPSARTQNPATNVKSPPPNTGGSQYAQYTAQTNAPWANSSTQARTKAQAHDAWRAWDSMKAGGTGAASRGYSSMRGAARGVPNMPPRPKPAASASASGNASPTPKARAGWSEPEDQRPGPGAFEGRPGPGLSRSSTTRSSRRAGFDPGAPQGDEPQARNSSAYYNVRGGAMKGARPQSFVHPTAPLYPPFSSKSRPEQFEGFGNAPSEENFGERLSTPYATGGGEKTYFSSANLFRNPQTEFTSNLSSGWDNENDNDNSQTRKGHDKHRHRSASPRMRSPRVDESSTSSESSSDEDESIATRTKLRPRGNQSREYVPPPPSPPPPQFAPPTAEGPSQPGLTVENEFGKKHEFSKPSKSSTWNTDLPSGKSQAQHLSEENMGRRTSTGNISEQHHHRSPQPSPLHEATSINPEKNFEPLEKPASWQQQYGCATNSGTQRRFEPPGSSGKALKYDNIFLKSASQIRELHKSTRRHVPRASRVETQSKSSTRKPVSWEIPDLIKLVNDADKSPSSSSSNSSDSTSPAKNDGSYFESHTWQERFANTEQNPFVPQNWTRNGSPAKGKSQNNLRVPRNNSLPQQHKESKPAKTGSDADSVRSMSSSPGSIGSGNAMDIDTSTPPAPTTAIPTQRSPRNSGMRRPDPDGHLNMKDFRNTAPFAPTNNNGIDNLNDLSSPLPFTSKAATTFPSKGLHIHKLTLPQPPKHPPIPSASALRKEQWEKYLERIRIYMTGWNTFNHRMIQHFEARQFSVENDLPKGWLEGIGGIGLSRYMSWIDEDDRVRTHWDCSIERHKAAMGEFQRIKKCASTAKFV